MKDIRRRKTKFYNGTGATSFQVKDLLTQVLSQISAVYQDKGEMILEAWPSIIGQRLSVMTKADSYINGILTVKVTNSTLHSLLSRNEKFKILTIIKQRFPTAGIQNIVFKIG